MDLPSSRKLKAEYLKADYVRTKQFEEIFGKKYINFIKVHLRTILLEGVENKVYL